MADLSTYRNKYLATTILSGYPQDPNTQAMLSKLDMSPDLVTNFSLSDGILCYKSENLVGKQHYTVAVHLGSIA
jgi:hypothetical protein